MIKIQKIETGSLFDKAGIRVGDELDSVNGEKIEDRLDFELFRTSHILDIVINRSGKALEFQISREYGKSLGVEVENMEMRTCRNNCVFCFVHQMPRGMRKSLYIKDEDYRYSFLDGNFTALSNMSEGDWERIQNLNLSPLYISVHTADPELRRKMTRNKKAEPIMDRLRWLADNGISFHTQMVIIPGWNDGKHLEYSLEQLSSLYPAILSISVVPVGLTAHRDGLEPLKGFSGKDAEKSLEIIKRWEAAIRKEHGTNFIYASDEIYLKSGADIPPGDFYGNYEQYENGVGMIRALLDDFEDAIPELHGIVPEEKITVITGMLAAPIQKQILDRLQHDCGLEYELIACENKTFGKSVTVTGLLCGADILDSIKKSKMTGKTLIPPNCLNQNNQFMDDMSLAELCEKSGRRVLAPASFRDYF